MSQPDNIIMHLNIAESLHKQGDHARALGALEDAKKALQEFYYQVWHSHHTSGTGGKK